MSTDDVDNGCRCRYLRSCYKMDTFNDPMNAIVSEVRRLMVYEIAKMRYRDTVPPWNGEIAKVSTL